MTEIGKINSKSEKALTILRKGGIIKIENIRSVIEAVITRRSWNAIDFKGFNSVNFSTTPLPDCFETYPNARFSAWNSIFGRQIINAWAVDYFYNGSLKLWTSTNFSTKSFSFDFADKNLIILYGRLAERSKARVLKTWNVKSVQGFESLTFRHSKEMDWKSVHFFAYCNISVISSAFSKKSCLHNSLLLRF